MPPRTTKKTPPDPGSKRALWSRAAAATANSQPQAPPEEPNVKSEDVDVAEEVTPLAVEKEAEQEEKVALESDYDSVKKDEDAKESIDKYEKGEWLDLEDNDPEYEPEEYGGVDYDEKEIEEDPHEDVGEVEEDPEELDAGEEEGDVVEEEMDSIHEELQHEEDDEHVGKEQANMAYAGEEEDHHEVFKERSKRKEFEIFVGGWIRMPLRISQKSF